jgi:hypothetical protein
MAGTFANIEGFICSKSVSAWKFVMVSCPTAAKLNTKVSLAAGPVSVFFAPVAAIIVLLEGVAGGSTIRIPVFEPSFVNVNDDCVYSPPS